MGPDTSSGTTTQTPIASIPVPSPNTQQATAQSGLDVIGNLLQTRNSLDTEISKATAKALVPIAGSGGTTSPSLMMTPVPGFQPTPLINKPVVGARANRDQGIANTIIAAANVVGKYETQAKQEKQRVLAVDLERVLQSQQGISEAQQILADDPNNAAAKDSLAKNQGIIDAMLKDPKKRKAIGRALDVNFTDPSQNNTDEHGAFKQAVSSYSQQLQKAMPANMQVDPQAVARLQSLQARQKSIDDMIKTLAPPSIRAQSAIGVAGIRAQTSLLDTAARVRATMAKDAADNAAKFKTAMAVTASRNNAAMSRTLTTIKGAMDRTQALIKSRMDLLTTKDNDFKTQLTILTNIGKLGQTQMKLDQDQLKNLDVQLSNKIIDQDTYDASKAAIQSDLDNLKNTMNSMSDYMRNTVGVNQGGVNQDGDSTDVTKSIPAAAQQPITVGQEADSDEGNDSDIYGTGEDNTEP